MSDDEKEDWKLDQLTDSQFENKVKNFFKEPRRGGDLATAEQAVRALNKQLNGDKMP